MRMDRAKDGIPVLFNHGRDAHLGIMGECRCDDDKVGRGTARFGQGPLASEKWKDVEDGILKDVSVGYEIHFMKEMDPKEMTPELMEMADREKLPVYRITDWEPYECSFVTVPADPTVGVGRSVGTGAEALEGEDAPKATITVTTSKQKGEREMEKNLEEMERDVEAQRKKAGDEARDKERGRVQGINDIYEKFKQFIPEFVRRKAVDEGMPLADFQALALKRLEDPEPVNSPVTELGLSARDLKRYSITRAILGQWKEYKGDAGFELACHAELIKRGVEAKNGGILIPYDIMRQNADPSGTGRRDLSLASDAVGGYLKGTDHLGSEFIDILRNAMVLRRAGARVISGLRGNVSIPKRTAGASSYWVTDGTAPTEGTSTFAQVALSPKNIAANIDFTRQLLLQSNPSIDALVNGDLALALALGGDLAGFHGTGADGQPQGIVGTDGVGSVTATAVNLTKMLEFQTDVAGANALAAGCAYVTTPAVAGILASQPRFTYGSRPLWEGNLLESADVCGFRGFATNQITAGYMLFGDFSQLLIGEWGVLELLVNPYAQGKAGIIEVVAFQTIDIALRYPGAFTVSTSVTAP